jgi:hypothetical protein
VIRDTLVPALKREFADQAVVYAAPPNPVATFPAKQEAVGRVIVLDDGDEATVVIEHITHGHFNPYDNTLSEAERDAWVTERVIEFLRALFSDRVLLSTSANNRIGGWTRLDLRDDPIELSPAHRYFLWSRPYES